VKPYFVYIIEGLRTSKLRHGEKIYYTGFTDNPERRLHEHKARYKSNFMKNNKIMPLRYVHIERVYGFFKALNREKQIKRLPLSEKLKLFK
jgi:predicted GIY-YIG superfamily endonuclease